MGPVIHERDSHMAKTIWAAAAGKPALSTYEPDANAVSIVCAAIAAAGRFEKIAKVAVSAFCCNHKAIVIC